MVVESWERYPPLSGYDSLSTNSLSRGPLMVVLGERLLPKSLPTHHPLMSLSRGLSTVVPRKRLQSKPLLRNQEGTGQTVKWSIELVKFSLQFVP